MLGAIWCRLTGKHRTLGPDEFVRNIYGDEINHSGGNRSLWRCANCRRLIDRPELRLDLEMAKRPKGEKIS
jgi:hypothetical protein